MCLCCNLGLETFKVVLALLMHRTKVRSQTLSDARFFLVSCHIGRTKIICQRVRSTRVYEENMPGDILGAQMLLPCVYWEHPFFSFAMFEQQSYSSSEEQRL